MPTQITQIDDKERSRTVLRIEGTLTMDDALLIEKIASAVHDESGRAVSVDISDIHFLDSDSASVLRRLAENSNVRLEGTDVFLQTAVNEAERNGSEG